jgi:hypothetical protein
MDLFSSVIEATTVDAGVDEQVVALCDFVKSLDDTTVKHIALAREAIDFDLWMKAVRGLQTFAFSNGLKDDWWHIVDIVTNARIDTFWNAGWDSAYEVAMCILLKPYVGTGVPQTHYDLLTGPLIQAGWSFKKVSA